MRTTGAKGISTLEVVAILAVASVMVGLTLPMMGRFMDARRQAGTEAQLINIKRGMVGSAGEILPGETLITQFGYVGDMGRIPASLDDLLIQGSQASYAVNSITQVGAGWRGPYINVPNLDTLKTDAWGNAIVYNTTTFTDSVTGATVMAQLKSIGADQVEGTADDLILNIYRAEVMANIVGYVKESVTGEVIEGSTQKLTFASNGTATTSTSISDASGRYSFSDIFYGEQVVRVEPKILVKKGSAITTGTDKNNVEFILANFHKDSNTVSSIRFDYTSDPQAYYKEVFINGVQVFSNFNPRGKSGDTISFSTLTVAGTGILSEANRVHVQAPELQLPDFSIPDLILGGELKVQINDFDDATSGNAGNNVDMTGVVITVTLSDGSVTSVRPRRGS